MIRGSHFLKREFIFLETPPPPPAMSDMPLARKDLMYYGEYYLQFNVPFSDIRSSRLKIISRKIKPI